MATGRRGRPSNASNPRVAAADIAIAKTMHKLVMWGFPRKCPPNHSGGGYADVAVAASARKLLGRTDVRGAALSGERICQIYAKCMPEIRARERDCIWHFPSRYPADERRRRMPIAARGQSLSRLAETILRDGGEWTEYDPGGMDELAFGDMPLTPAARRSTRWLRLKSG